nr:TPA_asm: replicase [Arceuthobium sichuanense virus 3]
MEHVPDLKPPAGGHFVTRESRIPWASRERTAICERQRSDWMSGSVFPCLGSVSLFFAPPALPGERLSLGPDQNCHLRLLKHFLQASPIAYQLLVSCLPESGPIAARDLAFILNTMIRFLGNADLVLPRVVLSEISHELFLHFHETLTDSVDIVISKLLCFDGYVGAVEPMQMISNAASVGAATIAANEASKSFRDILNAMVTVTTKLSSDEEYYIKRERTFVRFLDTNPGTNDHPLMCAYREIIRQDFDNMVNLKTINLRTLVLGATSREYRMYDCNQHVFFQFANRDGKDVSRTITDCLMDLKKNKTKKLTKHKVSIDSLDRKKNEMRSVDDMLKEWRVSRVLPERFLFWEETKEMFQQGTDARNAFTRFLSYFREPSDRPPIKFDVLVFQDVGYNFSANDWGDIFRATGVTMAYGYLCLPWELIQPVLAPSTAYTFKNEGRFSMMAYHGYSNGYCHRTRDWGVLMKNHVIRLSDFALQVEFVSRIGPMTCVQIFKTFARETVVRCLEVPEYLRAVEILDIRKSCDLKGAKMVCYKYFPIAFDEFHDSVNYALDISKDSLNFTNVLLYIRRRCSGVSLVTKELSRTWTAPKALHFDFALVVYLYTKFLLEDYVKFESASRSVSYSRFRSLVRSKISGMWAPLEPYYRFFKGQSLQLVLVKEQNYTFWQRTVINKFDNEEDGIFAGLDDEDLLDPSMKITNTEEDPDEHFCSLCTELVTGLGDQKFTCNRENPFEIDHDFSMSNDDLNTFRARLTDTTQDPAGLKTIKEDCLKKTPVSTFSHTAQIFYICGPPGTGKSHAIRALATKDDLIVAPLARLREDYTNFIHPVTGVKTSLNFKTQHTAVSAMNHLRIFVDEYTAMPYENLAIVVHNCGAREVFLVGDHRQVSLINEVEGISISSRIDISKLREHELINNYRNPKDVVWTLNKLYGYHMRPTLQSYGYRFLKTKDFSAYPDHTPLFFTHVTASAFAVDSQSANRVTVRANQGATFNNVKLIVTHRDAQLLRMPEMVIVALSRHKNECVIMSDDSEQANIFVGMIKNQVNQCKKAGDFKVNVPSMSPIFDSILLENVKQVATLQDKVLKEKVLKRQESLKKSSIPVPIKEQTSPVKVSGVVASFMSALRNLNIFATEVNEANMQSKINRPKDLVIDQVSRDKIMLDNVPNNNGCLIDSLAEITNNSDLNVWRSLCTSIGIAAVREFYNKPFTTDELEHFCNLNGFRVAVTTDGNTSATFGNNGTIIGTMQHFTGDPGHFISTMSMYMDIRGLDVIPTQNLVIANPEEIIGGTFDRANRNRDLRFASFERPHLGPDGVEFNPFDQVIVNDVNSDAASSDMAVGNDLQTGFIRTSNSDQQHDFEKPITREFEDQTTKEPEQETLDHVAQEAETCALNEQDVQLDNTTDIVTEQHMLDLEVGSVDTLVSQAKTTNTDTSQAQTSKTASPAKQTKPRMPKTPGTPSSKTEESSVRQTRSMTRGGPRKWKLSNTGLWEPTNKATSPKDKGSSKTTVTKPKKIGGSAGRSVASQPNPVLQPKDAPPKPYTDVDGDFLCMARLFCDPVYLETLLVEVDDDNTDHRVPLEQTPYDSFRLLTEDFATMCEMDLNITNEESMSYFDPSFDNGFFNLTKLDGLNQRRHPVKLKEKAWSLLNVAPGVTYFKNSLEQSLSCLQARYLTKAYSTYFSDQSKTLAYQIADLFFDEHMKEDFSIFNEEDLFSITLESEHTMKLKNYHKQTQFEGFDDYEVKFSMKDIFKPMKTSLNIFKAGQGISAWSKDMQTVFQSAFRIINRQFVKCLRDHVVFDNGIDERTLMLRVNALFSILPSTCVNGVIDATACDSGQNRFTQAIERRILEKMGINDEFLDWYYRHRESYTLRGYGVTAHVNDIKTSGEPATLLNNTILMACLMNYLIRGEGPTVLVIKGDDGVKRQSNMKHRVEFLPTLRSQVRMEFKVDIDTPINFCGYFLFGSQLLPDVMRKCFKLVGHRFRNYEHFTEYQQSLRDWVLNCNKLGVDVICQVTSAAYNLNYEYVVSLFYAIVSITHIGSKQFYKNFKCRDIELTPQIEVGMPWSLKLPWYSGAN